jgi:hypothetical protein
MIRRTTKESTAPDDLEGRPWLNTIAAWAEYDAKLIRDLMRYISHALSTPWLARVA